LKNHAIRLAVAVSLLALSPPTPADSYGDGCRGVRIEVPVASVVASAAILPNVLKTARSIRSESSRLLSEASSEIRLATPPAGVCPSTCAPADAPQVFFRSMPTTFRQDYAQQDHCERLFEETSRQPMTFRGREFESIDKVADWVEDLAMGRGEDGKALYEHCTNGCSPRYYWTISRNGSGLRVDTEVICGPARDRGDNEFELSYSLLWSCTNR